MRKYANIAIFTLMLSLPGMRRRHDDEVRVYSDIPFSFSLAYDDSPPTESRRSLFFTIIELFSSFIGCLIGIFLTKNFPIWHRLLIAVAFGFIFSVIVWFIIEAVR